jgi:hypothetical protein
VNVINGTPATHASAINLEDPSPRKRVLEYFAEVTDNSIYYGVMRRSQLLSIPFYKAIGTDWMLVASMACLGKIKTLPTVNLFRSEGGASRSLEQVGLNLGIPAVKAKNPFRILATSVFKDIAWRSPVYATMSQAERLYTAARASLMTYYRYSSFDASSPMIPINKVRYRLGLRTNLRRVFQSNS